MLRKPDRNSVSESGAGGRGSRSAAAPGEVACVGWGRAPRGPVDGSGLAERLRGKGFLITQSALGDRLATVYVDPYRALCPVSRGLMSYTGDIRTRTFVTCEKALRRAEKPGVPGWCPAWRAPVGALR